MSRTPRFVVSTSTHGYFARTQSTARVVVPGPTTQESPLRFISGKHSNRGSSSTKHCAIRSFLAALTWRLAPKYVFPKRPLERTARPPRESLKTTSKSAMSFMSFLKVGSDTLGLSSSRIWLKDKPPLRAADSRMKYRLALMDS